MASVVSHFQENRVAHREDLDLVLSIREDMAEDLTLCQSLLESDLIFQLNS